MSMGKRLQLHIASDHVRLDLLEPVRSTGFPMACRKFLAYLLGRDRAYYQVAGSETVKGRMDLNTLLSNVETVFNQLERSSHQKLTGSALEVELGPMFSRVGLLELVGDGATRLSSADQNTYAQAWVRRTWGLDPADYLIRISPLKDGRRYVLVCVPQMLPQQLSQWSSAKGLKSIDCIPALVSHLSQAPTQMTKTIMVFTENAVDANAPRIDQFVVLDESGPLSISRIWTDAADRAQQEAQVMQTVRRLCAQHQFQVEADIQRTAWPLTALVASRERTP